MNLLPRRKDEPITRTTGGPYRRKRESRPIPGRNGLFCLTKRKQTNPGHMGSDTLKKKAKTGKKEVVLGGKNIERTRTKEGGERGLDL